LAPAPCGRIHLDFKDLPGADAVRIGETVRRRNLINGLLQLAGVGSRVVVSGDRREGVALRNQIDRGLRHVILPLD